MSRYVRITFLPAGARRKRTVWAQRSRAGGRLVSFYRVTRDGERPEPNELIVGFAHEFSVQPARWNLHYAEMELGKPRSPAEGLLLNPEGGSP